MVNARTLTILLSQVCIYAFQPPYSHDNSDASCLNYSHIKCFSCSRRFDFDDDVSTRYLIALHHCVIKSDRAYEPFLFSLSHQYQHNSIDLTPKFLRRTHAFMSFKRGSLRLADRKMNEPRGFLSPISLPPLHRSIPTITFYGAQKRSFLSGSS